MFPGSGKVRNCRSVSGEGVTERMAPTPETGPDAWCSHRLWPWKFQGMQAPVARYSRHLRPQKYQGIETLSHKVQLPSAATEIPGHADPQSHGTATIYGHGNVKECRPPSHGAATAYGHENSREHRHQLHGADTTCSHRNSGKSRPQLHGTATNYGHGNSREHRPSFTWYSHHLWPRKFQGT